MSFERIAPHLANPLVLAGFALLLVFGIHRALIKARVIPPLARRDAPKVVFAILRYGFILAVATLAAGVGLAVWQSYLQRSSHRVITRLEAEALLQRNRPSIEHCLGPTSGSLMSLDFVFSTRPGGGISTDVVVGPVVPREWIHMPPPAKGEKLSVAWPEANGCIIGLLQGSLDAYTALPDETPFAHRYVTDLGVALGASAQGAETPANTAS